MEALACNQHQTAATCANPAQGTALVTSRNMLLMTLHETCCRKQRNNCLLTLQAHNCLSKHPHNQLSRQQSFPAVPHQPPYPCCIRF